MMNATENIIQFNTPEDKSVWGNIYTFLMRMGQNSENTRKTYERAIREFFRIMRNKELEELVEEDLIFTKAQVETYQVRMKEKYKGATVNNKMSALKRLYSRLEEHEFNVKASWFNVDRYDEHESDSYDPMTYDEIVQAINLVKETRKGEEKSLFIELAYSTSFRKESLRNIKFNDFYQYRGEWIVKTIGKGNVRDDKKVPDDLYERIVEFGKKEGKKKEDRVFRLTNKTINGMIKYIRENMDFGDRRIVFHSLKKSGIEEMALRTNYDLKAMQAQGNHANVATTLNHYMSKKRLDDMVVLDINYQPPVSKFEDMSKEELVNMLKNAPRDIQIKLLKQEGLE